MAESCTAVDYITPFYGWRFGEDHDMVVVITGVIPRITPNWNLVLSLEKTAYLVQKVSIEMASAVIKSEAAKTSHLKKISKKPKQANDQ